VIVIVRQVSVQYIPVFYMFTPALKLRDEILPQHKIIVKLTIISEIDRCWRCNS